MSMYTSIPFVLFKNEYDKISFARKVIMRDYLDRQAQRRSNSPPLDPVRSSRTPNADFEPTYSTRYTSPMFACILAYSIYARIFLAFKCCLYYDSCSDQIRSLLDWWNAQLDASIYAAPSRLTRQSCEPEMYIRASFPASRAATLPQNMYNIGTLPLFLSFRSLFIFLFACFFSLSLPASYKSVITFLPVTGSTGHIEVYGTFQGISSIFGFLLLARITRTVDSFRAWK